jgi:biopolymer transport protein ExbD
MGFSGRSFTLADRRRAARRRRSEYFCQIDVSPLLVIFFVLWLVVVPIGPFPDLPNAPTVDLPKGLHVKSLTGALREDAMFVCVTRDGRYFLGNSQISLDDLADRLRQGVWRGAERKAYLKVDRRAKCRSVKLALAEVLRSGINEIAILTN